MGDFSSSLDMNVRMMNEKLRVDKNFDMLTREIEIGGKRAAFYFIDGFVQEDMVEKLMQFFYSLKESDMKDIDTFFKEVANSGNSSFKYLQNVYSNTDVQHQNVSLALAISEDFLGKNGVCRVHGGGFAGTIQAFVKNDIVTEYQKIMDKVFGQGACSVLKIRKYGGMKVL